MQAELFLSLIASRALIISRLQNSDTDGEMVEIN